MTTRLAFLYPEIALFITTCIVMVLGLSRNLSARKATAWVAGLGLVIAGYLAIVSTPHTGGPSICPISGYHFSDGLTVSIGQIIFPNLPRYAKTVIAGVGLLLLLVIAGTVDQEEEAEIASGARRYDPMRSNRAEFYAFFLFSLTGLMLCAGADDLIWLFLALELTSLPTYVMVTISTARQRGREAGVKYFFLGALGAAIFLYGFALLFGATGTTNFNQMAEAFTVHGLGSLGIAGMCLAILGISFKIAAVPMHFYTPDVYEGAAPQVSGFLAFVPKTAGFLALFLLLGTVGWQFASTGAGLAGPFATTEALPVTAAAGHQLPEVIRIMLWVMAALTMTVGNVLALRQSSVKRLLAYSSIAHSGYMLVGVIAGPGEGFTRSGIAAVLFYLTAYGIMNTGAFAVIAALERRAKATGAAAEVESFDDLRGLCSSHPLLGWSMVICALSLLGLPPLLGFYAKLPLFTAGIAAREIPLVVILGINSAIAAFYYLRLAFTPFLEKRDAADVPILSSGHPSRAITAAISALGVLGLALFGSSLAQSSLDAGAFRPPTPSKGTVATPAVDSRTAPTLLQTRE